MQRTKILALLIGIATLSVGATAHAVPPTPWPDNWVCNAGPGVIPCLKITNTHTHFETSALSLISPGGRALDVHVSGTGIGLYSLVDSTGTVNSEAGLMYNYGAGYGAVIKGLGTGVGLYVSSVTQDSIQTVTNNVNKSALFARNTTGAAAIGADGYVIATGGYFVGSDERIKKNIVSGKRGLVDVLKLRSIEYDLKDITPNFAHQLGFSAQELQKVIPEAVKVHPENGMLLVEYSAIVPVLVKAIQDQQQQITALQKQLDSVAANVVP